MMRGAGQQSIIVLSQGTKRESGHQVQVGNINACKTIADVIRTSLGPRAILKMLMDPMGGIVMTNDGNAILRRKNDARCRTAANHRAQPGYEKREWTSGPSRKHQCLQDDRRRDSHQLGTTCHAQNADGSNGWNRDDQRRKRHLERYRREAAAKSTIEIAQDEKAGDGTTSTSSFRSVPSLDPHFFSDFPRQKKPKCTVREQAQYTYTSQNTREQKANMSNSKPIGSAMPILKFPLLVLIKVSNTMDLVEQLRLMTLNKRVRRFVISSTNRAPSDVAIELLNESSRIIVPEGDGPGATVDIEGEDTTAGILQFLLNRRIIPKLVVQSSGSPQGLSVIIANLPSANVGEVTLHQDSDEPATKELLATFSKSPRKVHFGNGMVAHIHLVKLFQSLTETQPSVGFEIRYSSAQGRKWMGEARFADRRVNGRTTFPTTMSLSPTTCAVLHTTDMVQYVLIIAGFPVD